jgi:hypothetical protein
MTRYDRDSKLPQLFERLYDLFPHDRKTLAVPFPRSCATIGIDVLIDWSNIYVGFVKNAQRQTKTSRRYVLDLEILDLIIARGRPCISRTVAGSQATLLAEDSEKAKALGYNTYQFELEFDEILQKRVERGVDEVLCFQLDEITKARTPGTIVLATGDGQRSSLNSEVSFYMAVEKALNNGWTVELYSFGHQLSHHWTILKRNFPTKFVYIYLDEFIGILECC